jgi:demethylmenaquinone methyltransferase/2-methoxy-6-polyprenyl-1,4-benzoquinol methylase
LTIIEESNHAFVRRIFSQTAPTYDHIVALTTFGQDIFWKQRMLHIAQKHASPDTILDLACGTGILTYKLARAFPESHITAIDLQEEYIQQAEEKKRRYGMERVEFHVQSAETVCTGKYDLITASYLPKYVDLDRVIANCAQILNPGGILIFHDFMYPEKLLLRILYNGYWLALRMFLWSRRDWREMSRELRSYIVKTNWVETIQRALQTNDLRDIQVEIQKFQIAAIVSARK